MTDEADETEPESAVQPFADLWSSYMQRPNEATEKMLDDLHGCTDLQAWRRRWLDALSESADAHMRSPVFLDAMKRNLDAMIQARKQASAGETAQPSNNPNQGDLGNLREKMDRIVSRLRDIEGRLEAIEDQPEWPQANSEATDEATE